MTQRGIKPDGTNPIEIRRAFQQINVQIRQIPIWVVGEIPTGAIDAVNKAFTTEFTFLEDSLIVVYRQGVQLRGGHFVENSAFNGFTMRNPPKGEVGYLWVIYRKDPDALG